MKPGPVQLLQAFFSKSSIQINPDGAPPSDYNPLKNALLLSGITVSVSFGFEMSPKFESDGHLIYAVNLELTVQPTQKDEGQRPTPYLVDVAAMANVLLLKWAHSHPDADKILRVHGAGILWSAVREHVAAITARMPHGVMNLPLLSFGSMFGESDPTLKPPLQSAGNLEAPVSSSKLRGRASKKSKDK